MNTSYRTLPAPRPAVDRQPFSCFVIGETSLLIRCGEMLLSRGHTLRGVVSSDPAVRAWAEAQGLAGTHPKDNLPAFFKPEPFDYLFSIINPAILTEDLLALPQKLAVNYHDSLLPRYAGMHATSWAIMHREPCHGITWHVMVPGVDEGCILKQRSVALSAHETAFSLNIKCYEAALESFSELLDDLSEGSQTLTVQDPAGRTYFGKRRRPPAACGLSWQMDAEDMSALVRSLDFGSHPNPLGSPRLVVGNTFAIVPRMQVLPSPSTSPPGTLLHGDEPSLTVATASHDIRIDRVIAPDGTSLSAAAWAESLHLHQGYRFSDLDPETAGRLTAVYDAAAQHEPFWATQLATLNPISFPADSRAPGCAAPHGCRSLRVAMPEAFLEYSATAGDTAGWESLLAAFAAYLARLTGTDRFDVGFACQTLDDTLSGLHGIFAACLPLRATADMSAGFRELTAALQGQLEQIKAHVTYPRDIFLRNPALASASDSLKQGLFPVLINRVTGLDDYTLPAGCEFCLVLADDPSACCWVFDPEVLSREAAGRLRKRFSVFLEAIAAAPDKPLAELPLLLPEETDKILYEWNDTEAAYCREACLHRLFEEQAAKTPHHIATVHEGSTLTYEALNRKANQLARHLQKKGVGPETLVGVSLDRSHSMIVALLGILKAGGAYVPLEPSFPRERLTGIIHSAGIQHVITQDRHAGLFAGQAVDRVSMDGDAPALAREDAARAPACRAASTNTAYVIFTSGSTGKPKGVVVTHQPVINLIEWVHKTFSFTEKDSVLFVTALSFDLSVFDIFGLLACGGRIHIVGNEQRKDAAALIDMLCEQDITFWDSAPAALDLLVPGLRSRGRPLKNKNLRLVFLSGDWIPLPIAGDIRQVFGNAEVIGLGGATEAAVWSNFFPITAVDPAWRSIPYGRPIQNARYYILDQNLSPCPVGVAGDLYIGGECLSSGYLNEPALTAQSFIPDPFCKRPGGRMYRTGDTARFFPDGNMEFLGRKDFQVKVRGYRIELGEIEHALRSHADITEAVAMVRQDTPGDQKLVAYAVARSGAAPPAKSLKKHAAATLPDYMVPNVIGLLDRLPLTANGKVDRKALPWPIRPAKNSLAQKSPRSAAAADMTSAVLAIIREVIQNDEIGPGDDLFDFGVTSLNLIQMADLIMKRLGATLRAEVFLDNPTPSAIAAVLQAATSSGPPAPDRAPPLESDPGLAPCQIAQAIQSRPPTSQGPLPGAERVAAVLAIIREIIQTEEIGPADDLFDFGVTSLNLIQMADLIKKRLGVTLRAEVFLDNPTPAAIAAVLPPESQDGPPAGDRAAREVSGPDQAPCQIAQAIQHRPAAAQAPRPGPEMAAAVLAIIREIIQSDEIGPEDDIFDFGVTSLNLIQMADLIKKRCGATLRAEAFLDNPTPNAIAVVLQAALDEAGSAAAPAAPQQPSGDSAVQPPLSEHGIIALEQAAFQPEAYRLRSSCRRFARDPISFEPFSAFLALLKQATVNGEPKHLYPSAGGLNAVQTYVMVKKDAIAGVGEGVYYYHPVRHALYLITGPLSEDPRIPVTGRRETLGAASFCIFFIARLDAITPIYTVMSRALVTLDAGYMGQLLQSRQAEFGLGLCPAAGVDFERLHALFKLSPDHLFVYSMRGGPAGTAAEPDRSGREAAGGADLFIPGTQDRSYLDTDRITQFDRLNSLSDEEHAALHGRQLHLRTFSNDTAVTALAEKQFDQDDYIRRATMRRYEDRPVSFTSFSRFMALLRQASVDGKKKYLYPSMGGTYAVQTYVHIKPNAVEGISRGIYYYDPAGHVLHPVAAALDRDIKTGHFPGNRAYYNQAGFSVFLIADLERLQSAFGGEGLHFATLEAGAMGQVLMDRQAEFDMGVCAIGGMRFNNIRDAFGLEPGHRLIHSFLCGPVTRSVEVPEQRRILDGAASAPQRPGILSRWFGSRQN